MTAGGLGAGGRFGAAGGAAGLGAAPAGPVRRVHIIQGEAKVEGHDPNVVMTTLLGSCVAACIRDPGTGIGGMNHFLLPGEGAAGGGQSESYGLYLMELLINGLMKKGARRHCLEAKLFGGARTVGGLSDIGAKNAAFARAFLDNEGIAYVGGSVGGDQGRRIEYWPASGRARQVLMEKTAGPAKASVFLREPSRAPAPAAVAPSGGDLELF